MITASVVLHNTPVEDVNKILSSYLPSSERRLFIYDNSEAYHSEYRYLSEINYVDFTFNGRNMGYGAANNLGIRKAVSLGSKYHIVMNPDLSFSPDMIESLIQYADAHPETVYLMPKIVDESGVVQPLCKLLPKPFDLIIRRFIPIRGAFRRAHDKYVLADFGYNRIINPPCLSGCFMFMRVETLIKHSLEFDERFFLYCEDFDLIRRLHRIGKTEYFPQVSAVHRQMRESYHSLPVLLIHVQSAFKYFNKYGWLFDRERDEMNNKILSELNIQ